MSVELQKLRQEVLREALLRGWTTPSAVQGWPQLPPERIERWYRRLYEAPTSPLSVGGRLVNHFMIGADPEFVFMDASQSRYDARHVGLKAGPAFGADNNGRLVELRPEPSRSALSVLASLWLAMRWMGVFHPNSFAYNWRSGGYAEGDGLGGHIHFGRKRATLREREVANLDRITHLLYVANVFDREEGRSRINKSQGGTYGQLGDTRKQPHGYEYRTLPSWIDSPWLAYLNLVLGKLVVALPEFVPGLCAGDGALTPEQARAQVRMVLAYFAPLDDDARLAFSILTKRGFPQHAQGIDIKANWGIFVGGPFGSTKEASKPDVFPKTIPPTAADELELMWAMFEGRAPELTPLVPTWSPSSLPKGYAQLITQVDTRVAPGLGEFAMDLCCHTGDRITLANLGNSPRFFRFEPRAQERIGKFGFFAKANVNFDFGADAGCLYMDATRHTPHEELFRLRRLIVESRAYPLWFINEVTSKSYEEWSKDVVVTKKESFKREFDSRF
jgi:hypothetical protein